MQLKPCMGRYIFDEPVNADFKLQFHLDQHWQSAEVITLEENHRQAEDKDYADMLNRFRIGEQTAEDMSKLQQRVRPLNHSELEGAVYISCKNKPVNMLNLKQLAVIKGEAVIFEATNVHPVIKNFKPPLGNNGNVKDTPFLQKLILKKGARVQLTFNIDTKDCLTNGTFGVVVDFLKRTSNTIDTIMIKFDEDHQGEQKRAAESKLTALYPGCTSIERVMFQYSLAKRSKNVANTAKVIQFPLSLCFAATAHRFQGQTVHKPNKVAMDFTTVFQPAQSYVMLSRVQSLSQLFIIGSVPENKFYASIEALDELKRLNNVSVNRNPSSWETTLPWSLKIATLNCHSLADKISDIKVDPILLLSDILCLSETWLKNEDQEGLKLPGYRLQLNSSGQGTGIATYFVEEKVEFVQDVKRPRMQMTKFRASEIDIISVYRSSDGELKDMVDTLKAIITQKQTTIILGDFNLCMIDDKTNGVTQYLEEEGFSQHVFEATHLLGGHIDHVYSNHDQAIYTLDIILYSPYYTCRDHDAVLVTIKKISDSKV